MLRLHLQYLTLRPIDWKDLGANSVLDFKSILVFSRNRNIVTLAEENMNPPLSIYIYNKLKKNPFKNVKSAENVKKSLSVIFSGQPPPPKKKTQQKTVANKIILQRGKSYTFWNWLFDQNNLSILIQNIPK